MVSGAIEAFGAVAYAPAFFAKKLPVGNALFAAELPATTM
jgi:hypothetical protein